ncbi:hypothetical protein KR222_002362 [Zaprionus bogoriensis]|nr:hypothetical protein KR222_002362 [Zaprionus bogoriensis]
MSSTEESNSPATTPQENELPPGEQADPRDLEKIEEEKLKSKYPSGMRVPGGHSAFLQKRLQKGVRSEMWKNRDVLINVILFQQKFFDSGDYQMAKQKGGGVKQVFANKVTTGEAIPTPETVPARKTSIIQPCNKFPTTS